MIPEILENYLLSRDDAALQRVVEENMVAVGRMTCDDPRKTGCLVQVAGDRPYDFMFVAIAFDNLCGPRSSPKVERIDAIKARAQEILDARHRARRVLGTPRPEMAV